MGKYALIIISGFALTFGFLRYYLDSADASFVDSIVEEYEQSVAKLVAHSLANMALSTLEGDTDWRTGYASVSFGGGTGWAQVQDPFTDASLTGNQVRVIAMGNRGGTGYMVNVKGFIPKWGGIRAAVMANSDVSTLGKLVIDGRDHAWDDSSLLLLSGVYGVSTTDSLLQSGAAIAGGTNEADYAPSDPANPAIVETNAPRLPSTPDSLLNIPDGRLKRIAMSGSGGSQYVKDPTQLTFPLQGVTYVELADGDVWLDVKCGASSGLLVVHNSAGNAKIKNLGSIEKIKGRETPGDIFKGVIIADDIEHIHSTVLGAVISLTKSPTGNCIGNGAGQVLYSRESVRRALKKAVGEGVTVTSWDGSVIANSGQHGSVVR